MKNLTLILLLIVNSIFSQVRVTYKIAPTEENTLAPGAPPHIVELSEKSREAIKDFTFYLDVKDNRSHFFFEGGMGSDVDPYDLVQGTAISSYVKGDEFWTDIQAGRQIVKKLSEFVGSKLKSSDWKISSEVRKIDNYQCYKAEYSYEYTTTKGKLMKRTIIAWFAPELPYAFGPGKFSGLPGLILELNDGWRGTYQAVKIEKKENLPEIKMPEKFVEEEVYYGQIAKEMRKTRG